MSCNSFNFNGCTAVDVGYDFSKKITYNDPENTAIDLTGYVFSMSIQAKNTAVDLLTLSIVGDDSSTGIYIPTPENGEIFIQIRKADTTALGVGSFNYSIRMTDPDGNDSVFMYGDLSAVGVG